MAEHKYVLVVDDDSAFPEGRGVCCEVAGDFLGCKEPTGSTYSEVHYMKPFPRKQ